MNRHDDKANDHADKHALLMRRNNKRKNNAIEKRWDRIWIGANTLSLVLIVYMIYIFFIRG